MAPSFAREFNPPQTTKYNQKTKKCTIEAFLAGKDPYRVVPENQLPTPWRFAATDPSTKLSSIMTSEHFRSRIQYVLKKYDIIAERLEPFQILGRPGPNTPPVDILFISTNDEDTTYWVDAVSQLLTLFRKEGFAESKIKIEIRNPTKM
ncbi:hypothetical protein G7Y89_g11593 [Cudoniella acicularis]|uniref:Uncharacterized protein n=1 Tax=Cudoniella acicularis TaxID=354080 RepID=A0A8H4RCU6_9HELO|nr:hypothetical protein G7Y89_g11593 [Cudoniella acicularis]